MRNQTTRCLRAPRKPPRALVVMFLFVALSLVTFSTLKLWAQQSSGDLPSYQRSPSNVVWSGSGASAPSSVWSWFEGGDAQDAGDANSGRVRSVAGASGGPTRTKNPTQFTSPQPPVDQSPILGAGPGMSAAPGLMPLPGANQPYGSPPNTEMIRGIPSPSATFNQKNNPQAGPNCDETEASRNGAMQNGQQGPQTPFMFKPSDYPRNIGFGEPLTGTSWLNRPFHVDFFSGTMIGADAIDGVVGQESGFFVGGRVGWDYDYYWGIESRLGMSWMSLYDKQNPLNDIGNGNIVVWDMSLLYYPWGDSRWRPFVMVGTGIEQFDSYGSTPQVYSATLFEIPFGAGLKYHYNEWLTWRFDVIDNWCFGTGSLDTQHNISFDAGFEYHFGGERRNYWPWNPNPTH